MSVKLKAALPKDDESNGLDDGVRDEFLAEPRKLKVGLVVEETVTSLASGLVTPKVRVERIELFTDAEEADAAVRRMQALSEVRTGLTPLPTIGKSDALDFDDDDEDAAFADSPEQQAVIYGDGPEVA